MIDKIWAIAEKYGLEDKLANAIDYYGGMDKLMDNLDDASTEKEIAAEIIDFID